MNNSVYRLEGDHQSYTQQSLMGVNDMTIRNTKKSVQLDSGNNFSVVQQPSTRHQRSQNFQVILGSGDVLPTTLPAASFRPSNGSMPQTANLPPQTNSPDHSASGIHQYLSPVDYSS